MKGAFVSLQLLRHGLAEMPFYTAALAGRLHGYLPSVNQVPQNRQGAL